jgi:hypothetical protein
VIIVAAKSTRCNSSSDCLVPARPRPIIDKSKASPRDIAIEISRAVARLHCPMKKLLRCLHQGWQTPMSTSPCSGYPAEKYLRML